MNKVSMLIEKYINKKGTSLNEASVFPIVEIEELFYDYINGEMSDNYYDKITSRLDNKVNDAIRKITTEIGSNAIEEFNDSKSKNKNLEDFIKKSTIKFIRTFRPKSKVEKDFIQMLNNNHWLGMYIDYTYEILDKQRGKAFPMIKY